MDILERYVAIDNKCAWPNLTLMPDGSLLVAIFGEPCHLSWEGAAECWCSRDGGRTWSFVSVPVPNQPLTNRGHHQLGRVPVPEGFWLRIRLQPGRAATAENRGDRYHRAHRSVDGKRRFSVPAPVVGVLH